MNMVVDKCWAARTWVGLMVLLAAGAGLLSGCAPGPRLLPEAEQKIIDRSLIEYPAGFELRPFVVNLTAPTAITFDGDGTLLIAESGTGGSEPRIFGYRPDGKQIPIYPRGRKVPFLKTGFRIRGPIGGMAVSDGKIYVSHRDDHNLGVITAFDFEGNHQTVIADLPAQGDYGVTDIAVHPINGRVFFGVGTATNSGVVGIDNWQRGWLRDYPKTHDVPHTELKVHGLKFFTPNPFAGLFGGKDVAVTGPFHAFEQSIPTWVAKAPTGKPNGAVYSVDPGGGDLRVEVHGVHNPRGLGFNVYNRLYMTDTGMELRGSRPVKDDPDALLWCVRDTWYGWPDFSRDLLPITDERFKPPVEMIIKTGYEELSNVIDHETSGLLRPDRSTLLAATFPPLSGAGKLAFAPNRGPWKPFANHALVAEDGDRAPFATNRLKLNRVVGYKVVQVNMDNRQVSDFINNTRGVPGSRLANPLALERPVDVKLHPSNGSLYILDFGEMQMRGGQEKITPRSGKIYRLVPIASDKAEGGTAAN